MKEVHTIAELIDALDGFVPVARWAGYTDSRGVHNWVLRGEIPPSYHLRLLLEADRKQIKFDPEKIFGLDPDDASLLRAMLTERKIAPPDHAVA